MAFIKKIILTLKAMVIWRYTPSDNDNIEKADSLCGQAFGFRGPKDIDEKTRIPGLSNEVLAAIIRDFRQNRNDLPISIQGEIAQANALKGKITERDNVIFYSRKHGEYVSCYEIEFQTWEWMKKNGYRNVILATHPLLIWRMRKTFERLIENDRLEGQASVIIMPGLKRIPYDPKSTQWRTRNLLMWIVYELLARIHHIWITGWI